MKSIKIQILTKDHDGDSRSDLELLSDLNELIVSQFSKLLKEAKPNRLRHHQLIKLMMTECHPVTDQQKVSKQIEQFFALKPQQRSNQAFREIFGCEPNPWLRDQFDLHFANALCSETDLYRLAIRIQDLTRRHFSFPTPIANTGMYHLIVHRLTQPRWDEPNIDINIFDFTRIWEKLAQQSFADQYNIFFDLLNNRIKNIEAREAAFDPATLLDLTTTSSSGDLHLTQLELDWCKQILIATQLCWSPPAYPLSSGPKNKYSKELEQICRLLHLQRKTPIIPAGAAQKLSSHLAHTCKRYLDHYAQPPIIWVKSAAS